MTWKGKLQVVDIIQRLILQKFLNHIIILRLIEGLSEKKN